MAFYFAPPRTAIQRASKRATNYDSRTLILSKFYDPPIESEREMLDQSDYLLHLAAGDGDCHEVLKLISLGWDVNLLDEIGYSPLMGAVISKKIEAARILLEAGALPNLSDVEVDGYAPLGYVADKCSVEMAKLLLKHGADPTLRIGMVISATENARRRGGDDPVYLLLKAWEKNNKKKGGVTQETVNREWKRRKDGPLY